MSYVRENPLRSSDTVKKLENIPNSSSEDIVEQNIKELKVYTSNKRQII